MNERSLTKKRIAFDTFGLASILIRKRDQNRYLKWCVLKNALRSFGVN